MEDVERTEDQKEFVEFTLKGANPESKTAYLKMDKKQYDRVMPPMINLGVRVVTEASCDERCCVDGHVWGSAWEEVTPGWPYLLTGVCLVCGAVGHKGITQEEVARVPAHRDAAKA